MLCLDVSNSMGEDSGLKCGPPQVRRRREHADSPKLSLGNPASSATLFAPPENNPTWTTAT